MFNEYEAKEYAQGKRNLAVGHFQDNVWIAIYYSTVIGIFDSEGFILNTGGYRTLTTKRHINGMLRGSGFSVYQKDYKWYIYNEELEDSIPYVDKMKILWRVENCKTLQDESMLMLE